MPVTLNMTRAECEAFLADVHIGVVSIADGVRVSFLVQKEDMPQAYVSVEGPVTSVVPSTLEVEVEIAGRYLGEEVARGYVASRQELRAADPNVIARVRPERWLSRDFMRQIRAMQEAAAAQTPE